MKTKDYLSILTEEIHSVVVATVNDKGLPATRVIDIMLHDDENLYFLTAKGKVFYDQLMNKKYISLSGMTQGPGTMDRKAISITGSVENIGRDKLEEIFKKNTYMADIYSSKESRTALEVFRLYKGQGEYFDLSTKPITRCSFTLGNSEIREFGYFITDKCNRCGFCVTKCPQNCIEEGIPYKINQEHCLHCGNCYDVCPQKAIIKRG